MSTSHQLSPSIYFQLALGSAYGISDVGLVRHSNEDNFLIDQELGLVVIGDGMGGHYGGEIASASALTLLRDYLRTTILAQGLGEPAPPAVPKSHDPDATWQDQNMPAVLTLFDAIEHVNAQVYAVNLEACSGDGRGMGTTLTGFWHCGNTGPLIVFHVGDSRLYRYRRGELSILTRDHTLYQQAIEDGIVDNLPPRNLLLQAIGPSAAVTPDVKAASHEEGDVYLLCSDGLYGNTPHAALAGALAKAHPQNLEQCCLDLIDLAKQHGSRDNITAVVTLCHRSC